MSASKPSLFPPSNRWYGKLLGWMLPPLVAAGLGMWAGAEIQKERLAVLASTVAEHKAEGHPSTREALVGLSRDVVHLQEQVARHTEDAARSTAALQRQISELPRPRGWRPPDE